MRFSFLHAADLHLDTPFHGIGQVSGRIGDALRDASLDAFDALIALAIREDVRFVLLAGDLYDGANRGIRAQHRFLKGLERLSARGIRTFIAHGNHDPLNGWSAIKTWPPGVRVFGHEEVERHAIRPSDTEGSGDEAPYATIHGISYAHAAMHANLSLRFRRGPEPGLHLGVLHCNVGNNREHDAYSPCSLDDLKSAGMDYWALGHVHRRQILAREPWIVYPGNLQGRSPKPSEREPKGALVVSVSDGRIQEPRFEPLDRIRFAALEVDLAELDDLAGLQRKLQQEAEALQARHDGRSLILRARLMGRGALYSELRHPGRLDELLEVLRQEGDRPHGFLWWEDLRNDAAPALEREKLLLQGSFTSELLRLQDARLADRERMRGFVERRLEQLSRFRGLLNPLDDAEVEALLREAEALALDLLEHDT